MQEKIEGKYRKGVFVVAYSIERGKTFYLLLKRKLHWKGWEFPKGGMEKGEEVMAAVKRELREETGLKPLSIKKFSISGKYNYDKDYPDRPGLKGQTYALYAAELKKGKVRIDKREHSGYEWLEFEDALERLTWPNQRKCLIIVNNWLNRETR